MPHHRLRADASASAAHNAHPRDGPRGIDPRWIPAETAEFTEAVPQALGAPGDLLAGCPGFAHADGPNGERAAEANVKARSTVRLARAVNGRDDGPALSRATNNAQAAEEQGPSLWPGRGQTVRSWPLLILALPAAVAGLVRVGGDRPDDGIRANTSPARHLGLFASRHRGHPAGRRRGLCRLRAAGLAVRQHRGVRPHPQIRPPVRDRLAAAGHDRADRLPPPRPSPGNARAVGHHHRGILPARPGLGMGGALAHLLRTDAHRRDLPARPSPLPRTRRTTLASARTTLPQRSGPAGSPRHRLPPRCSARRASASPGAPCARLASTAPTPTWAHWRASSTPSQPTGRVRRLRRPHRPGAVSGTVDTARD